ncbi:MAG: NADP-dependent oxidoreductase [Candidatus Parcubacteria bacterium]|nr:NADP-dependent oxidoreductase [Burkholderiales bacterium]
MALTNRQYRLASRPVGLAKQGDWSFTTEPVADPADGQVLVKVLELSLDPAMRGWMNEGRSYIPPVGIGEVMRAGGVGTVIASKNPKFVVGEHVAGGFGIQEYCLVDAKDLSRVGLHKIDLRLGSPTKWLNALGMPGMTAYFGLLEVGKAKPGDTVVVSGAAGAVGQTVGQVARIKGCRVVGIAGGKAKCDFVVNDLKFDACIDYKNASVKDGLKEHCPKGVDVYFDNVGGEILDTVLTRINRGARIVICGAISQYNNTTPVKGPDNYLSLLVNRASMQGMVVFDYADRYAEAVGEIAQWMKEGKFVSREDVVSGIETFPATLNKLFSGENFGKLVLKVGAG